MSVASTVVATPMKMGFNIPSDFSLSAITTTLVQAVNAGLLYQRFVRHNNAPSAFLMPLLSFDKVSIAFGLQPLLEEASLQIDGGERICLIGRNGAGKSTLLKLVAGAILPDAGKVWRQPALRIGMLPQTLPTATNTWSRVRDHRRRPTRYRQAAGRLSQRRPAGRPSTHASGAGAPGPVATRVGSARRWQLNQRIETIISRLQLPAERPLAAFRLAAARGAGGQTLVSDPELLLLDEPTNHLDVEAIEWLEEQLLAFRGGKLAHHPRPRPPWSGSPPSHPGVGSRAAQLPARRLKVNFLAKKAAALEEEARHNALFDKKLSQEEAWLRQGIKARRTRNEGRVRALEAMREERRQRREVQGEVQLDMEQAAASGQVVIEAQALTFAHTGKPIVKNLSLRIRRGDRIGLIGPNGAGKTTLLGLLLGQIKPDSGSVRLGTNLEIAYFDQLRADLDPDQSVLDNIAGGRESITLNGKTRHIKGYLQDFLFAPERVLTPVKALSGGECNRLLLARLFSKAFNLLVMDEPTNDLDIETLELLEERLLEFSGTLLLVSHDRRLLDNIATSSLVFEGNGRVREYVGGYSDWLRQRPPPAASKPKISAPTAKPQAAATPSKSRRLSYEEQRELARLPDRIERLETELDALQAAVANPEFYKQAIADQLPTRERLTALATELETAYERWNALERMSEKK
ncbi:MAG: ATP-binding cassette domain-containing protein [Gammaproteobacteria bacterium]